MGSTANVQHGPAARTRSFGEPQRRVLERTPRTPNTARRFRALTSGVIVLAAVVVVCVGVLGGEVDPAGAPTATATASATLRSVNHTVEPPAHTGCSTTASLASPSNPTGWEETWRMDVGWGDVLTAPSWQAFSAGDCLVIASSRSRDTPGRLVGYRLTPTGAERLWARSEDDVDGEAVNRIYLHGYGQWWGGYLVAGGLLIDPSTGDLTRAPWADQVGTVVTVGEELAISCARSYRITEGSSCSAWDWNGGAPSQRWKQNYKEESLDPILGYLPGGSTQPGSLLARLNTESRSARAYTVLSLADGSIHGRWPDTEIDTPYVFIPARDGWMLLSGIQRQATLITADGQEGEQFPVIDERPTVMLAGDQLPMLAQLRAAYRDGDFDWADVVLRCQSTSTCTLNGSDVELPADVLIDSRLDADYYQGASAVTGDGSSLLLVTRGDEITWTVVFNTRSGQAQIPAFSRDRSKGHALARITDDLILMLVGSEVIAYAPTS